MREESYDLLIVGGGILGAGIARDAALRGVKTRLVEQSDFASGTSSNTSRLLHGGLRYLAQGNLKLVFEASQEKVVLGKIAPHLAKPLSFIFPTHKNSGWQKWKLHIGVKIYDALCYGKNFGRSEALSKKETLSHLPQLLEDNLKGAVRYFDGFTSDARLVLDNLRSANEAGAQLTNYTALRHSEFKNDLWHCELFNTKGEIEKITSRVVVNASGPWLDKHPQSQIKLRPTKGAHIIINKEKLPINYAVVMPKEKRILFAIPWGQRVIIGTTDTDHHGALSRIHCDQDDINYILSVVNHYFPEAEISYSDIQSTYAGLRPLIFDNKKGPSEISRKHEIRECDNRWFDVGGGKLTTYRRIAEETCDAFEQHVNVSVSSCQTAKKELLSQALLDLNNTSSTVPPEYSDALVRYYCQHEWARHIDDVMWRRTGWKHYMPDSGEIALKVMDVMADFYHWGHQDKEREWLKYQQTL